MHLKKIILITLLTTSRLTIGAQHEFDENNSFEFNALLIVYEKSI